MGDVILATPLVRQLRATYPDAQIDVAVAERFSDVWRNNPRVSNVWAVPEQMPNQSYDLVVDLQGNARSRTVRTSIAGKTVRIRKHRLEKLALVYLKRRPPVVTPITTRYRNAVAQLPLLVDADGPEVWLPEDAAAGGEYKPPYTARKRDYTHQPTQGELRIAVAPGAHHYTKRWPAERFAALCKGLVDQGASVVLVGGPNDVELCKAVAIASGVSVVNRAGARSVQDTARILDTCELLVTNDTGVMHLASARRIPIVAIFGSTVGDLGFAPYGVPHTIVEYTIACRPCTHIGRASCPRGHFLCMHGVSVDMVLNATNDLLQRNN